jgi:hypothetical protein
MVASITWRSRYLNNYMQKFHHTGSLHSFAEGIIGAGGGTKPVGVDGVEM